MQKQGNEHTQKNDKNAVVIIKCNLNFLELYIYI